MGSALHISQRAANPGRCYIHISADAVNKLGQAGNFASAVILMINALGSSLADSGNSVLESGLGGFLIICLDSGFDLADGSLDSRANGFVSGSLGLVYKDSFLCGFNICQCLHLVSYSDFMNFKNLVPRINTVLP